MFLQVPVDNRSNPFWLYLLLKKLFTGVTSSKVYFKLVTAIFGLSQYYLVGFELNQYK